jgi:hypothetical protein
VAGKVIGVTNTGGTGVPVYSYTYDPADPESVATGDLLTTGEETMSRIGLTNAAAVAPVSGQLRFTHFTARKSETTTQVRVYSGGTAAAATPTLCRIGLWLIDSSGGGTLVASTANDTTLFAAANTAYTRSWSTPYAKIGGQRYAIAPLVVSATTMPTFPGQSIVMASEANQPPAICNALSGQTDLPASFLVGSLTISGHRMYAAIL